MDKWRTKMVWIANGIPTPRFRILNEKENWPSVARELGLPLIVKPANEGSTLGLTKVTAAKQLPEAYELATKKYKDIALAEQFIDGPEYTASVLGDEALPLIRIEAPKGNYDYQNKYFTDDTKYHCPSGLPAKKEEALKALTLARLPRRRLPRLGARRHHARREEKAVAAGSEHLAGHDRAQPGADGGARGGHRLRGPLRAHSGARPCRLGRIPTSCSRRESWPGWRCSAPASAPSTGCCCPSTSRSRGSS